MSERVYKSGEPVPESGIYRVLHYRHRLPHEVTILDLERFPQCQSCGDQVRFVLLQPMHSVEQDRDFGT